MEPTSEDGRGEGRDWIRPWNRLWIVEATLETLEASLGISQATLDPSQEHVGAKGPLTSGHTKDPRF